MSDTTPGLPASTNFPVLRDGRQDGRPGLENTSDKRIILYKERNSVGSGDHSGVNFPVVMKEGSRTKSVCNSKLRVLNITDFKTIGTKRPSPS